MCFYYQTRKALLKENTYIQDSKIFDHKRDFKIKKTANVLISLIYL